jgi:hypothetical protein
LQAAVVGAVFSLRQPLGRHLLVGTIANLGGYPTLAINTWSFSSNHRDFLRRRWPILR